MANPQLRPVTSMLNEYANGLYNRLVANPIIFLPSLEMLKRIKPEFKDNKLRLKPANVPVPHEVAPSAADPDFAAPVPEFQQKRRQSGDSFKGETESRISGKPPGREREPLREERERLRAAASRLI